MEMVKDFLGSAGWLKEGIVKDECRYVFVRDNFKKRALYL